MLVLSRKVGEAIYIADNIEILITRIEHDKVRVAIAAPREIAIFRAELIAPRGSSSASRPGAAH